ncbi:DUF2306 domain-containing protein [Heyndrickxia sporothermodurans]|uniref:DUF2306 domain-containing protein n=1 Tax=Heyndrickxia sporothermodurans TaxID=46224 RepID=UPI0035DB9C50
MNKRKLSWAVLLCYLGILAFVEYILLAYGFNDPRKASIVSGKFENPEFSFNTWRIFFYFHIVTGAIALILGPFQLLKKSRKNIHIHRSIGKIYVTSIFLSVPVGIYLAFYATGGIGSTIGFLILDIFWFATTFIGLKRIRERKIQSHQRWMIRSYAITLVFVTFRLLMPITVFLLHLGFSVGFPLAIIISIIINLSLTERYLKKKRKGLAKSDYTLKTPTI